MASNPARATDGRFTPTRLMSLALLTGQFGPIQMRATSVSIWPAPRWPVSYPFELVLRPGAETRRATAFQGRRGEILDSTALEGHRTPDRSGATVPQGTEERSQ